MFRCSFHRRRRRSPRHLGKRPNTRTNPRPPSGGPISRWTPARPVGCDPDTRRQRAEDSR